MDELVHLGQAGGRADRGALGDGLAEGPVLLVGLAGDVLVEGLDVDVGDALGILPTQLDRVAAAVDDVPGVQTQVDVGRVGGVEDAGDLLGGLDVGVAVGVEDHLEAVLVQEHLPQGVGVLDVELPGVVGQDAVVGPLPGLVVPIERGQVDDVLGADGGVGLGDGAEGLERGLPGLLLVQDAPAGTGDHPHTELVTPLLELLGVGREVAEGAGLDDLEAGLGHLLPGLTGVHLLGVLGEPDAPLVRADTDGELGVLGIVGVDGFGHRCLLRGATSESFRMRDPRYTSTDRKHRVLY